MQIIVLVLFSNFILHYGLYTLILYIDVMQLLILKSTKLDKYLGDM